jgi:UDP-glucose:(heptosyl)LPS alpha-1,3-glucosyltransferase
VKLAIVRQRYTPFGGAERFVERALAALGVDRELDLTLICRRWQGTVESEHRHLLVCDPPYFGRLWRDRSFAQAARRHFDEFDLVQSHERIAGCHVYRAGDGVHAAWLAHLAQARGTLARRALALSPYHRYVLAAEGAMFNDPALRAVICNSRLVADEIRQHYGVGEDKLHVIHNGVDLERFHPRLAAEHRAATRARLDVPEAAPLFLFVGSGFERKGVPALIEAFARLPRRDAQLVIVGADRRLDRLRRHAGELGLGGRVHFCGGVADVRPFYGAADAFVLPTLYDPFPNAALEALACGLPIVTSTACGAAEFVREGVNGYVVPALDVAALAERLSTLAETAGDEGRRAAARASVEGLSLETLAEALQSLYRSLAGARNPL